MATRVVEGKKPYTGGKAISIDENKVISLNLRDENNLIIYDSGDDEIYVDLQLPDGIEPTDAFPVGITTGRVLVADDWDITGTIICAKTTSGDNIKILYGDNGTLWMDNGTGTFKQIYFKADVDAIAQAIWNYINANLNTKTFKLTNNQDLTNAQAAYDYYLDGGNPIVVNQFGYKFFITNFINQDTLELACSNIDKTTNANGYNTLYQEMLYFTIQSDEVTAITQISKDWSILDTTVDYPTPYTPTYNGSPATKKYVDGKITTSSTAPSNPTEGMLWYDTTNDVLKSYDGSQWIECGGSDIEYVTQDEYTALLPGAASDGKHYFVYVNTTPAPRQPGVNTVAYYPLKEDTNDYSGNNRDLINSGVTFTGGVGNFDGNSYADRSWTEQLNTGYTISLIAKSTVNNTAFIFDMRNNNEYGQGVYLVTENSYFKTRQQKASSDEEEYNRSRDGNENHRVITWTGSVWTVYFNGTQVKQATINNSINTSNTNLVLGARTITYTGKYTGTIREFIVENTPRTQTDVDNYRASMGL